MDLEPNLHVIVGSGLAQGPKRKTNLLQGFSTKNSRLGLKPVRSHLDPAGAYVARQLDVTLASLDVLADHGRVGRVKLVGTAELCQLDG